MTFDTLGTFDPAAPEAEQAAWSAGLLLNDPAADLDEYLPDGRTKRELVTSIYQGYYTHRKERGLPLFPNQQAKAGAEQSKAFREAYRGLDKLPETLKPEQWQQVELAAGDSVDPDEDKARIINANYFSGLMGREVPPESLAQVRDQYAASIGISGPVTHKGLYQEISKRHDEDEADAANFSAAITGAIEKRLSTVGKLDMKAPTPDNAEIKGFDRPGPPSLEWKPTKEDRDAALAGISERNKPEFLRRWNAANRELSATFRKHAPLVEEIARGVAIGKEQRNAETALMDRIGQWTNKLPDDPKERGIVLAMVGNALSNNPAIDQTFLNRLRQGAWRGPYLFGGKMNVAAEAQARQIFRTFDGKRPASLATGQELPRSIEGTGFGSDISQAFRLKAQELQDTIVGQGLSLHSVTDNIIQSSAIAAAPSAWMSVAAFNPIGQFAIVEGMAGDSVANAARNSPDTPEGLRTNAALASGMVQGVIETFSNVTAVKAMTGKLPRFSALLNKANIASPAGRAALGFVAGASGVGAMEYTEEMAQGATDLAFQALADDLGGQNPDVDWGGYFKDWLTVAGPEQKETLLAVMGFGMVAGAGASYQHFKHGSALVRSKNFLRANGLTEAETRAALNAATPEAFTAAVQQGFQAAQARAAADPAVQAANAEKKREFIEILKAQNAALERAGMPRVVKEKNSFTEEDAFVFIDTTTGDRQSFATEEEALGAWAEWRNNLSEEDLDTIRKAGEQGFIQNVTAEGQASEGTIVEDIAKTVTPETELTAAQQELKQAEDDTRRADNTIQQARARARLENAKDKISRVKARVEIFLLDQGIDPKNANAATAAMRGVIIKGKQFATRIGDQIVGYTVQLFNGREIQDIAEEFSENAVTRAIDAGFLDPEILLANLRDFEEASGIRLVDPGFRYTPGDTLPIIEGFSKLARGYLMSEVRGGLLPPEVAAWLEMQASLLATSVELAKELGQGMDFAKDVQLAGDIREATAAGYLPPRLEKMLKDALGLDAEAQARRLQKRHEDQLAAEAMQGFPEVSDTLKGKLPHPETLRENNHPLYGEVRRLWESMKKATKRRTKDGKTVDRTNEANAFFLPIGTMEDLDSVRQWANERGFGFDTITDMLDALDTSLSYGKPVYGTQGGETFSIGRADGQDQGSSMADDYRDAHRAPSNDGATDEDIMEGNGDPSMAQASRGVHNQPPDYFDPVVGPRYYLYDDEAGMESLRAITSKEKTVMVYRTVPNFVTAKTLVRGDWVSPSKTYAVNHGEARFGEGEYRIIAQKVSKDHLFWDNNDIREWGFDDSTPEVADDDIPFSVGRATVTPTAETRAIQGTNGETVIGPASFAIGAWHGTPHKVDKFTTEKIGTGEGAQAYGWGLYFAESQAVGEDYASRLSGPSWLNANSWKLGKAAIKEAMDGGASGREIIRRANEILTDQAAKIDKAYPAVIQDYYRAANNLPEIYKGGGNLYRVNLKVEDEDLLDWDSAPITTRNDDLHSGPIPEKMAVALLGWQDVADADGLQDAVKRAEREFAPGGETSLLGMFHGDKEPYSTEKRDWWAAAYVNAAATGRWVYQRLSGGKWKSNGAAFSGDGKDAAEALLKVGIRGIRYLDGNSRADGEGSYNYVIFSDSDIEIVEENGKPVTNAGETFAMSTAGVLRLESAIARRMTKGPDERVEFYQKLRDRLASTVLMLRETKRNLVTEQSDTEREKNRIRDGIAEAQAILKALPPEARARVPMSMTDIIDADTERGQINALLRLIDKADEALETVLVKEYREAFETLLDLAKPDLRQNKTIRGRLTPQTQRLVGQIYEATILTPAELAVKLTAKQAEIDALEASNPATPEEIKASQTELVELYQSQSILEHFGSFGTMDAAQTAAAYEQLQSIYITGRTTRKILDEARREELDAARKELLSTLAEVSQAQHAEKLAERGAGVFAEAWRLGMSSFHQVMEDLFPRSTTARDMQDRVRAADRSFVRAKLAAKERFDAFTYSVWNLSGRSRHRRRNRILADLSTLRDDWGITLQEGTAFATEKLTEEQAAKIVAGEMKTGWEDDIIAMTSLRQALADFRMQRLKAKNEEKQFRSTVIRFQRLTRRGQPGPFVASDLQALYYLQLYAQEQYRPALDKYGFTEAVMTQMEAKLNPKARDIGEFLRDEYDQEWNRLNPVYRAIYGLDMPKIRNYAPGLFEHLDAKGPGTDSTIDPTGAPAGVNAMSAGFTKMRTHHMARPRLTNALAGYWSHMEATEYFIAYAETVRDIRQIFRNPEVRRRIEGTRGKDAADTFSKWLDAIEVDGNFKAVQMRALAEMSHKLMATQSAVGLAFNVGVLFKQLSASFGVLLEMPHKAAITGLFRVLQNPASMKAVWNSEAVQQRVMFGISPEDRRMLDAAQASPSVWMDLLELGRLPIALADAVFTTASASVAYEYHRGEAKKAGLSDAQAEESALRAASRVIERTAQPATTQDKSMAELTATGFGKFLFLFRSDPRQKLAIAMNAVADWKKGRTNTATLARKLAYGWMLYGLAGEVMTDIWAAISRDDDDPERWDWRDYLASMITGPISGAPLAGQSVEWAIRSTIGTKAFSNSPNPLDQATRVPSTTRKLVEAITADDVDVSDVLTASQQLAAAASMPVGTVKPQFAIVPAALRVTRDAYGMVTNFASLFMEPSADDQRLAVIEEIAKDQKTTRDGKTEANDALAKELAKLPPDERMRRLGKLDKATATAMLQRLRAADMTASEAALKRLTKENRAAAVEKITAGMSEEEKRDYLTRLQSLGL